MNRYVMSELAAFAATAGLLFFVFPSHPIAIYGAVVLTYVLLQVVSALAFCVALHKGLVREHLPAPYKYSASPECKKDWLVMRHIWTYLPSASA